jgi:cytidylate kinase
MKPFQIAIDGPVASGKSTTARLLADKLGFTYVDTGAMYRAITLVALERQIDLTDEQALTKLVHEVAIDVRFPQSDERDGRLSTVLIDGRDVSWDIRKANINENVHLVASLPLVREALVVKQQAIAQARDVVMEGRDITYVVLPEAQLKIFLDANESVRIERFYLMLKSKNHQIVKEDAANLLRERDELDRNREASPLKIVEGVWHYDSSGKTIEEVVDEISARVTEMRQA